MRTINVTIVFRPEDESFDRLTGEALVSTIENGLLRAFPLLRSNELVVSEDIDCHCGHKRSQHADSIEEPSSTDECIWCECLTFDPWPDGPQGIIDPSRRPSE